MVWCLGGSLVARGLEELRQALEDFYGSINEYQALVESQPNLASTITIPDKPTSLILWEQCQAFGLPLLSGGVADQPHLWLEEVAVIRQTQQLFSAIQERGKNV